MMKVFDDKTTPYENKVNFLDDKNVLVGYDMGESCCEHFGWFVSGSPTADIPEESTPEDGIKEWPAFVFDVTREPQELGVDDEGGTIAFRLTKGDEEMFLHLFNSHNGYYSHGFTFKDGDKVLKEGSL